MRAADPFLDYRGGDRYPWSHTVGAATQLSQEETLA